MVGSSAAELSRRASWGRGPEDTGVDLGGGGSACAGMGSACAEMGWSSRSWGPETGRGWEVEGDERWGEREGRRWGEEVVEEGGRGSPPDDPNQKPSIVAGFRSTPLRISGVSVGSPVFSACSIAIF